MTPGDIALVHFPFTDASASKKRPVLIVGVSPTGPSEDEIVVTVQITGSEFRISNPKKGDLLISDWTKAKLHKRSLVRCRRLFGVRPNDILKVFGQLDGPTFGRVQDEIRLLLGL